MAELIGIKKTLKSSPKGAFWRLLSFVYFYLLQFEKGLLDKLEPIRFCMREKFYNFQIQDNFENE